MRDEHSLKMSAPKLFRFGIDSVWKIFELKDHSLTHLIIESMNCGAAYRTAPATLGLVNILIVKQSAKNILCQGLAQHLGKQSR